MVQKLCVCRRRHPRKNFSMKTKNPPIIRPGQRHPYHKASQREIDERRGAVARLLARGLSKMAIHRFIRAKFFRQWRTADRDIAFVIGITNK
jgi:hypothetical protein